MHIKTETSPSELRKFGYVMGGFIGLFFGIFFPWLWSFSWPRWPWIIALGFFALAVIYPASLKLPYKFWMRLSDVLGWINTRIILGAVFILIFSPLGFLMRTLGKDTLDKKWDPRLKTYRTEKSPRKPDHMERQF